MQLTAVYMKVPEGYIAFVEELPGANTQGETLEEAKKNLREAVALVMEANRNCHNDKSLDKNVFVNRWLWCPNERIDLIKYIKRQGCVQLRDAGNHAVYCNPINNQTTVVCCLTPGLG
jgi:predicted RNase H-like HicB family nuclease